MHGRSPSEWLLTDWCMRGVRERQPAGGMRYTFAGAQSGH
jgi:hypothetical protein